MNGMKDYDDMDQKERDALCADIAKKQAEAEAFLKTGIHDPWGKLDFID